MIIILGGEKGGTGKTTVAVNLAAMAVTQKMDIVLVDTDKQGSATDWSRFRDEQPHVESITTVALSGNTRRDLLKLREKYEHVLVDVGGRDSEELRSAMLSAEVMYTPVRASQFDLGGLKRLNGLLNQARVYNPDLKAFVFINCASTNVKVTDTDDALEFIVDFNEINLASPVICDRAAFRKTGFTGLGVHELKGKDYSASAVSELNKLFNEVFHG